MLRLYMLGAVIVVVLIWGGLTYRSCKHNWELEEQAKAQKVVEESTKETTDEQKKRAEAVERMQPGDLLKYWHGLQHDDSGGGTASPPSKAKPKQP